MKKIIWALALLLVALLGSSCEALTVNSLPELVTAILVSPDTTIELGANITMDSSSSDIPIARPLTLKAAAGTTLNGGGSYRIFTVNANVTFEGITFTNAKPAAGVGGAVNITNGTVTFTGCTFSNNTSSVSGGAVHVTGGTAGFGGTTSFSANSAPSGGALSSLSPLSFGDVTFSGNIATGNGGAVNASSDVTFTTGTLTATGNTAGGSGGVINTAGTVTLRGGTFTTNKANGGSGGAISASSISSSASTTFTGNEASGSGGALNSTGTVTLAGGSFNTNKSGMSGNGGAINAASVNLTSAATFTGNEAGASGGAVQATGNVTFANATFDANKANAGDGGAISANGDLNVPSASGGTFTGNSAQAKGGAVFARNIVLSNSVFTGNKALTDGGGATYSNESSTFTNCIFGGTGKGNTAEDSGGAVSSGGALIAESCSFISNETKRDGGALYIQAGGTGGSRIDGSWLVDNKAGKDGGAVHFGASALSIAFRRSLFSGNAALDANFGGGAVFVLGTGTFERCTFTGNTASASASSTKAIMGGAVYAAPTTGSTSIVNSTFTNNEARSSQNDSLGGALYLSGKSDLLYCTLTNQNTASSRGSNSNGLGGGIYVVTGPLSITASAVAGNAASFGSDIFRASGVTINTGGYNRLGEYGITSQSHPTNYPWTSDSNVKGGKDYDETGISQSSMFGNGALAINDTSQVNVADITIGALVGATDAQAKLLTVALVISTANPGLDQIPFREGNLFASRIDQRNLSRPQPAGGRFDVGAFEAQQDGGTGPGPNPDEYYVDYVKMSGIPNTMRKIGQTSSLTALVYPSRAEQGVTWSSSNPSVARVDQYGNLVSLLQGTTTITATSVGMTEKGTRATDSADLSVSEEWSNTNVHPDVARKLGLFNTSIQQYAQQVYLLDADPALVQASSFQSAFKSAYGTMPSQVTELQNANALALNSKPSYTGTNWVSVKPSISVSLSSVNGGSLLPLQYTYSMSWDEVSKIMGKTVTKIESVTELFGKLKLLFEGVNGKTVPVVDADGAFGVAASQAVSNGALTMTNGNNGLTLSFIIYLGDIADGRPKLIGNVLVVPDGTADGTASGSMWLLKHTGASGGGTETSSGGGGGCDTGTGLAALVLLAAGMAARRKHL